MSDIQDGHSTNEETSVQEEDLVVRTANAVCRFGMHCTALSTGKRFQEVRGNIVSFNVKIKL